MSPTCRSACSAPTASSAPALPIALGSALGASDCARPARSRPCSSATARWPKACCTNASTWRRSGSCRSCSSARTTAGPNSRRPRGSSRSKPEELAGAFEIACRARRRQRCRGRARGGRSSAIEAARAGGGPRILECSTTRVRGHFEGDPQKYRDPGESTRSGARTRSRAPRMRLRALGVPDGEIAAIDEAARRRSRRGGRPRGRARHRAEPPRRLWPMSITKASRTLTPAEAAA